MTKCFFSLLLLVAFGNGVLAGTPLKSSSKGCAMSRQMKCCKRDTLSRQTPEEITTANLCRRVFCEQSGTTASNVRTPQFSSLVFAIAYLQTLNFLPVKAKPLPKTEFRVRKISRENNPLYLQNLTIRI